MRRQTAPLGLIVALRDNLRLGMTGLRRYSPISQLIRNYALAERPITMLELTTDVVTSYLQKNRVAQSDLPGLIQSVYAAITGMATPAEPAEEAAATPTAAQIRKSIKPDGLISFIDQKTYKTLKRHLATAGFTPDSYRERYGLPKDYPMVAASYSAARSEMAKAIGLGAKGRTVSATPTVATGSRGVKLATPTMKPTDEPDA